MYSSLERVDFLVQSDDGSVEFVQTDHRTATEIEFTRDLSTVFAIIRVALPVRMGLERRARYKVRYAVDRPPPPFLHQAIASAGGVLEVARKEVAYQGPSANVQQLLDGSFSNLGRAVAQRLGKPLTREGLAEVERHYRGTGVNPEDDEVAYWTAVVELGSFAGEVMRALKGGAWGVTLQPIGTLPVAFHCGPHIVNFLGKATKHFDTDEGDSLAAMVEVICDRMEREGPAGQSPPGAASGAPAKRKGPLGGLFSKR